MIEKIYKTSLGNIHYWINIVDRDSITLVFLPGLTADHRLFDKQITYFENKYNVFVWDAPAHASSWPFEFDFDLMDKVKWLNDILEYEGIQKPVIVGQSMGGYVGQAYAELYPKQLKGFISIDSAPLQRKYVTGLELWLLKRMEPVYYYYPWKSLLKAGTNGVAVSEYGRKLMHDMMMTYDGDKKRYSRIAGHGYKILAEAMEKDLPYAIECPALLICGKKDKAGSCIRYNKAWNKNTSIPIEWIEDAGHNSNTDKPEVINDLIEKMILENGLSCDKILDFSKRVYNLKSYEMEQVSGHDGGRNIVYICSQNGENKFILRVSILGDKEEKDYLAETEFVHYLAKNEAPVADVILSVNNKYVECIECDGKEIYISLFAYAKGMLISENGYRYREGAPLTEYFYNTGKALGKIHKLSKKYSPTYRRGNYFDKYNMDYINYLIPDTYAALKAAISERLEVFHTLPMQEDYFGLVHFDFSDGNYHIDMENGELTVFDFDNCMYCWYMFDLANLWTHGVGWYQFETDIAKRMAGMEQYFSTILEGYRSETEVSDELLDQLQLFIDMVLIENIVDEFECCAREGEEVDYEDIENAAECLINKIAYAGFCEE